jgi:scyllo-inositol 2-dehydrogenase (NADP+)
VEFTSHYDRYKPLDVVNKDAWKEKSGEFNDAIYNLGSHLIDQVLTLFGAPKSVTCRSWPMRGVQGLDDSVSLD